MRLIRDHREALALHRGELADLLQREGEGLDGADDDLLARAQRLGQLLALACAFAGDNGDDALGALESLHCLPQLLVQHRAVRDDQHRVEHLPAVRVMQVGQEMRCPGDRIRLPRPRRVLDQIAPAGAIFQHRRHQLPGRVELVETGEDPASQPLLLVLHRDQVATEDLQPAIPLPHLLPQIGGGRAVGVGRVAGAELMALVEGQEAAIRAVQARAHPHLAVADGEMHERPAWEAEDRLRDVLARRLRGPVVAILVHRILDTLGVVGLEFRGGHRDAVQEQHQVEAVLMVRRIAHLSHHPQPIAGIARRQRRVHAERRAELTQADGPPQPHHVEPLPQQVERALLVERRAQPIRQRRCSGRAVCLRQRIPGVGLGCLHPGDQVIDEQAACAVVAGGGAVLIQPARAAEMRADHALEGDLLVDGCHFVPAGAANWPASHAL